MDFDRERSWVDRCFHHDLPAVPMDILGEITAAYYRPTTYLHVLITVQSSRVPGTVRPISMVSESTVVVLQSTILSTSLKHTPIQEEIRPVSQAFMYTKSLPRSSLFFLQRKESCCKSIVIIAHDISMVKSYTPTQLRYNRFEK